MADVTTVFKATVKTIKTRHKATGDGGGGDNFGSILGHKKHKGPFEVKAKDVVNTVTKLRDFLLQHRKEYINAGSHLISESSGMTDAERDQIDMDTQKIIKTCQETISGLRQEASSQPVQPQMKEHRIAVISLIEKYLKAVCKIHSEQRAVRVKRVVDRKRISRLEPEKMMSRAAKIEARREILESALEEKARNAEKERMGKDRENWTGKQETGEEKKDREKPTAMSPSKVALEENSFMTEEDEITVEEAQLFEQENKALFEELNGMVEEVNQIQGKVVEVAKLQEIFTEKVLEQEKDIDRISHTTVGATENIKDGNEQIREAMKKKAEFRVWILFFLLVSSFSLLFLDWYNA